MADETPAEVDFDGEAEHGRPSPDRTRSPTARDAAPDRRLDLVDTLANLSSMGIFGFLGLLARLGLFALGTYNGQSSFALLWAQAVGCALMGAFTVRKERIEEIYLPLYAGLASGLCGSITSFSAWMADVFQAFSHTGYPSSASHSGFHNFVDGFGQSIFTLAASVAAFTFGTHVGPVLLQSSIVAKLVCWHRFRRRSSGSRTWRRAAQRHGGSKEGSELQNGHVVSSQNGARSSNGHAQQQQQQQAAVQRSSPTRPAFRQRSPLLVHLGVCSVFLSLWLTSILLCVYVSKWRGTVLFGLVMAPPGVWLRFYLSRLNFLEHKITRGRRFPLGTFIANQFGTAVLAACLAVQYTRGANSTSSRSALLTCQALQGLSDGLCGCLTTVSTFIVEIRKLERRDAYIYALASWSVGQVLVLVILGSVDFSKGGGLQKCVLR